MDVGLTRVISLFYIAIFGPFLIMALVNAEIMGVQLDRSYDIWVPLFLVVVSCGVYRRTRWGRWLAYPISLVLCIGVPLGTLLGGYMVWHLTKYRSAFTQWY